MWCQSCQHGHIPVMRYIKDLGREVSVCPCCGAELHEDVISSKGEQILEIAKRMGVKIQVLGPEVKGFKIGKDNEEKDNFKAAEVTRDNVTEKVGVILDEQTPKAKSKKK